MTKKMIIGLSLIAGLFVSTAKADIMKYDKESTPVLCNFLGYVSAGGAGVITQFTKETIATVTDEISTRDDFSQKACESEFKVGAIDGALKNLNKVISHEN